MQPWIGNAIGAAIGLVAILIGALWNAHLTRKRDRSLREEEILSFKGALGAELAVYVEHAAGRVGQLIGISGRGMSPELLDALKPPAPTVWPRLCDKVGLLDLHLSRDVVRAWSILEWHMSMVAASVEEAKQDRLDRKNLHIRCERFAKDLRFFKSVIERLGGPVPQGMLLPEFGV